MNKVIIAIVAVAVIGLAAQIIINKKTSDVIQAKINDLGTLVSADRAAAVSRFAGKPAVIFIVGTFCPHCQSAMPEYKTNIWDVYADPIIGNGLAHVFAHVSDGQGGKRFEVADIAQGFDAKLDYKTLTGEDCNFVPSWVLLDAQGTVADSSCGTAKSQTALIAGIEAEIAKSTSAEAESTPVQE